MSPRQSPIMAALRALSEGQMTLNEFLLQFSGKRIPGLSGSMQEEQDRRAYELVGQLGVTVAAKRLGMSRTTAYRAINRHLGRLRLAA